MNELNQISTKIATTGCKVGKLTCSEVALQTLDRTSTKGVFTSDSIAIFY